MVKLIWKLDDIAVSGMDLNWFGTIGDVALRRKPIL